MSAAVILARLQRDARVRALASAALLALPWMLALAVVAWRMDTPAWGWLLPLLPAACALAAGVRAWRRLDRQWLVHALDARRADMEDSAALLVGTAAPRNALETLQRTRLRQRLETTPRDDLRARWRPGLLAASAALAAVLAALAAWCPVPARGQRAVPAARSGAAATAGPPRIVSASLTVTPPAYTGLPARTGTALSVRVPEASTLAWRLRFAPQPPRAELVFLDGTRQPLRREGATWSARRVLARPALYRIEAAGLAQPRAPYRIDVVPDRAPRIRVLAPARTLNIVAAGQRRWAVAFEASDDHGLAPTATLQVTRTVGSGENITSQRSALALPGSGNATRRRYAHGFDLAALGLVPGDDLIVRLEVSDRRAPRAQRATSPSLILRWPPEQGAQATGFDGLVKRAMPAYFRSQRQIIIDAEALLKDKPRIAADNFIARSDALGVDQRLLRLRYGQFLGEESEGGAKLPTGDAPTSDAPPDAGTPQAAQAGGTARDADAQGGEHAAGDGHDHGAGAPPQREAAFGEARQAVERYGHAHDVPEAATLLDPKTRELLRSALDAMWSSELGLRQGDPKAALPHAYRALELIKRVQQAERIYLAKSGVAVAPVDQSRRMTGKRDGLGNRADPLRAATRAPDPVADAWRALAPGADTARAMERVDALSRSPALQAARGGDALAIAAAIDTLRRAPGCGACRARLRAALWPLVARPPGAPEARAPLDRAGAAYLDALRGEAGR